MNFNKGSIIPLDDDSYILKDAYGWSLYRYNNFIRRLYEFEAMFIDKTIDYCTSTL